MAREVGFRYPYIALVKENTETNYKADTPVKLGRGIECKITKKQESNEWRSDNTTEEMIYGEPSIEMDITINELTPELKVLLYGGTYTKGAYVPPTIAKPNEVAYMDEILMSDGSYNKRVFYCGKFDLPSEDNKTLDKKPDSKGIQLKAKFYNRQLDNRNGYEFYGNATGKDTTIEKAWFTSVQEPPKEESK